MQKFDMENLPNSFPGKVQERRSLFLRGAAPPENAMILPAAGLHAKEVAFQHGPLRLVNRVAPREKRFDMP